MVGPFIKMKYATWCDTIDWSRLPGLDVLLCPIWRNYLILPVRVCSACFRHVLCYLTKGYWSSRYIIIILYKEILRKWRKSCSLYISLSTKSLSKATMGGRLLPWRFLAIRSVFIQDIAPIWSFDRIFHLLVL